MEILELNENQKNEYQSFVSANGCFLQDWDWGDFQRHLGKKVFRFGVRAENGFVLVAQAIENAVRGKKYFFMPYGPVTAAGNENALKDFLKALAKRYPELIFVRVEPQYLEMREGGKFVKSIDLNPHQTLILDLQKSEEELLAGMHSKTRYNIKVSQKHQVKVQIRNQLENAAARLFDLTAHRAGVRFQDAKYFDTMLKFFSSDQRQIQAKLYMASHQDEVIAANLMIFWNKTVVYLFGASSSEKRNVMAPYALHWQAIRDAKNQGDRIYDFWGVETDPKHPWHGFSKFKLGFGGEIVKYAGTFDYLAQPAWYNVYRLFRKLNRIAKK